MQMHLSLFNDIPPHEPPLRASSRPIPRIRIWPIKSDISNGKIHFGSGEFSLPQRAFLFTYCFTFISMSLNFASAVNIYLTLNAGALGAIIVFETRAV